MYKELKFSYTTREAYNADKANINPDALIFIEDEEVLITPFKEYQFVTKKMFDGLVTSDDLDKAIEDALNCTLDTKVFKVVESLPTQPASGDENKIHLVRAGNTEIATIATQAQNVFEEFLYVEGNWELLGKVQMEVDFSNLVTFDDVATSEKNGLVSKDCANLLNLLYENVHIKQFNKPYTMVGTEDYYIPYDVYFKANNGGTASGTYTITLKPATPTSPGIMSQTQAAKLDSIKQEWYGTQSEYDALGTYDANTKYFILSDASAATLENKELTKIEVPFESQVEDVKEEDIDTLIPDVQQDVNVIPKVDNTDLSININLINKGLKHD